MKRIDLLAVPAEDGGYRHRDGSPYPTKAK
jgi:hypothetical protein